MQSHFSLSGSVEDAYWIVPITLFVGSYDKQKKFLLDSKILKLELSELLPLSKENDSLTALIKVNVEQTGFYRVKHDDTISNLLREAVKCHSLSTVDRYGKSISRLDYFSLRVNLST